MYLRGSTWVALCAIAGVLAWSQLTAPPAHQPETEISPGAASSSGLRKPLLLIRRGKTEEARQELRRLLDGDPTNAEIWYQIARSYLMDFHAGRDPRRARMSLSLAMEALANTLKGDPDHVYALQAKSVIHARAELLYYDPNLAYDLATRVARLQPYANEYLLGLAEWMSGEVRFTGESGHRVPHDPLLGLDRAAGILERVIDGAVPYSNEESAALFLMAKTLAKRGRFADSLEFYDLTLSRPATGEQRMAIQRELGASLYHMGRYGEAARAFYAALEVRINAVDQWLLKVALEAWKQELSDLPPEFVFPAAAPPVTGAQLAFADIAKDLGVNRLDGNGTCAWGDYDGDGDQDLLLAGSGTFIALYRNDGGRFVEVTAAAGLDRVPSGYSLNVIDYDNDGKLDIYLALNGWSGPMANRLYRNLGNGRFQDVSKESGAADAGSGFVSLWGDLDNDGYLDLVVANGVLKDGSVPQIYRNTGKGTFLNVTRAAGLDEPPSWGAIGAALGDYDRDGDLDIFFNGLDGSPNRLYRNDGAFRFTEVARQAGVTQAPHNGFVAFFVDYNDDGRPDLLTTSLAPWDAVVTGLSKLFSVPKREAIHRDAPRLFRNNGDGTFSDITFESQLYAPMGVMGAGVADVDNDGFVDFYFGTGDPQLSRLEPNRFFHNNGDGTFSDVTNVVGFARPGNKGHGVTFIDIDNDGDLDIYAQLGGHYPGDHAENAFYRNLKGNRNHWLQVELAGTKSNAFAVGATLLLKAGELTQHREVKGSEGFGASNPYRVHFGLGRHVRADSLDIFWPSGKRQTLVNIESNQLLRIRE